MNAIYIEAFRSLRDDFKRFQRREVIDKMANIVAQDSLDSRFHKISSTSGAAEIPMPGHQATPVSPLSTESSNKFGDGIARGDGCKQLSDCQSTSAMGSDLSRIAEGTSESDHNSFECETSNNTRTRKGHKKSRQGCYSCKKRKIKVAYFLTTLPLDIQLRFI
jgi:hypothetical protein